MAANNAAFSLGLAQKAGKAVSGDFAVREALKGGKVKLLVIAADAAENTKKDLLYIAESAGVPVIEALSRVEIGVAIGKAPRASVAITDANFVKMLTKNLK